MNFFALEIVGPPLGASVTHVALLVMRRPSKTLIITFTSLLLGHILDK